MATVMRVADRHKLDQESKRRLRESLELVERFFDGLGFCLSQEDDLLSQWRGYADDARGVAIGFDRDYLEALAIKSRLNSTAGFEIHKIEYDPAQHEVLVEPVYLELQKYIAAGAFRPRAAQGMLNLKTPQQLAEEDAQTNTAERAILPKVLDLLPLLFKLKTGAFREEAEWRLVSTLGAHRFENCLFRAAGEKIIPYRSFSLEPLDRPAITEVVLGSKNQTPIPVIESLMANAGFQNTRIRQSRATYR